MPIEHEGLSGRRAASRIGKVRLGHKAKSAKGTEYPEALDYFRIDPEDETLQTLLHDIYGEKPTRLRILLVSDDLERVFPQYLRKYGKSGQLCKGTGGVDGEGKPKPALFRLVDKDTGEVADDYPCDPDTCEDYQNGRCKRVASFQFVLRDFPALRVWQIDTTSEISISRLNTRLADLAELSRAVGRRTLYAGVPLVLSLGPVQVKPKGHKKKKTVYCMDLELDHESLMGGQDPMVAFLSRLGGSLKLPEPDDAQAPDGLYERSQVEPGADPAAERAVLQAGKVGDAEEAEVVEDDGTAGLPAEIVESVRNVGLSKRQVRNLVARFVDKGTGELKEEGLNGYLHSLADLKGSDEQSYKVVVASLNLVEPGMEEPEPAKQTPSGPPASSADVLGLEQRQETEEQGGGLDV